MLTRNVVGVKSPPAAFRLYRRHTRHPPLAGDSSPSESIMDYEAYDNDANPSDDDYFMFVDWLSRMTASELHAAKGDPGEQKEALCRYYRRGLLANLTAPELIDFLGTDTPSVLEMAGYTEQEARELMRISDGLTLENLNGFDGGRASAPAAVSRLQQEHSQPGNE